MNSATGVVDLLMVTEESVMIVIETYDVFIIAKWRTFIDCVVDTGD